MKLTKRQKFIAACAVPTYGGFASKEEVKKVKLLVRGHYWDEGEDFEQFCSYSPGGKRAYFNYNWFSWGTKKQFKRWKDEARLCAKLWAKGECAYALFLEKQHYETSDVK